MRIALLSTYFENIGDDLIRSGILEVVNSTFPNAKIIHLSKSNRFSLVADFGTLTHFPRWQMSGSEKLWHDRLLRYFPKGIFQKRFNDRVLGSDVLLIAGTPLFYFTRKKFTFLKQGFWAKEIIQEYMKTGKPIIVAGAGVIFDRSVEDTVHECQDEMEFLNNLARYSEYFGIRDSVSFQLFEELGLTKQVELTHCPSLWNTGPKVQREKDLVYISLSVESASIDEFPERAREKRLQVFTELVQDLQKKGKRIKLTAHNNVDHETQKVWASKLSLEAPILVKSKEMLETFGKPEFLISWRVHGAMAARLMGTPVLLFKTDNRYKMAEEVGAVIRDDREFEVEDTPDVLRRFLENPESGQLPADEIENEKRRLSTILKSIPNG